MPKSHRKKRWSTTIDTGLLRQFKILAVQEDKRFNQLLEESMRDVLAKYERNSSSPATRLVTRQKRIEQEKPDPNSLSLQGVETTLQEMAKELQDTRRAIERGPKKVSSVIPALTGLVVGLVFSGLFFTANYSDLLRYKFELDARAIMLSRSEGYSAKAAKVGIIGNSITGQQDESHELRAVGIDGQTQLSGLQPQSMGNGGVTPEFEPALPTTPTTFAGILPASEIPAPAELFSCKLNAIAWDQNPAQRLAVLDDRILHEGDLVGGATVLRINPDHVVFSSQNEVFIKKMDSEPSGDGER